MRNGLSFSSKGHKATCHSCWGFNNAIGLRKRVEGTPSPTGFVDSYCASSGCQALHPTSSWGDSCTPPMFRRRNLRLQDAVHRWHPSWWPVEPVWKAYPSDAETRALFSSLECCQAQVHLLEPKETETHTLLGLALSSSLE